MTMYKMFKSISTADVDVSDSIDIQADGVLEYASVGVSISAGTGDAAGDFVRAEVSFLSSEQFNSHDVRGSICMATAVIGAVSTNGAFGLVSNPFCIVNGLSLRVNAGERIFIHVQSDEAAVSGAGVAYLHVRDGQGSLASQRRR